MTTLYLDTEFNGFGGSLISIALYDPEGMGFYAVLNPKYYDPVDPWVAEHVIPALDGPPMSNATCQRMLVKFLSGKLRPLTIVADWPADFEHLFRLMNQGAPWRVDIPMTAVLVDTPKLYPETPHNALSDAMALAKWHMSLTKEKTDA